MFISNTSDAHGTNLQDGIIELPLYTWLSETLAFAGQEAYFGKVLHKVAPTMVRDFLGFDALWWQVVHRYPASWARQMHMHKDKCIDGLQAYLETPPAERADAAFYPRTLEREMRRIQVPTRDIATKLFTTYIGYV